VEFLEQKVANLMRLYLKVDGDLDPQVSKVMRGLLHGESEEALIETLANTQIEFDVFVDGPACRKVAQILHEQLWHSG